MRSTVVGILANALLAIIKGTAGYLGNSYALIADAIESFSDVISSLIVWSGLRIAAKPPDHDHRYGHGKAETLAAAVVALALCGAAIIICVQSLEEILSPIQNAPKSFTLLVLVLVILTKELLFRFVFQVGQAVGSVAVKTDAWHHRSDAMTSAAAFVGISIALIGGAGYESADDWAALFAAGIIAYNAYRLFVPAIKELMDTAPSPAIAAHVRDIASGVEGVFALDKCNVRKVGFEFYVDLHVLVAGDMPVREGHKIAHQVKDAVKLSDPRIADVLVHLEPEDVEICAATSK